MQKVLLLCGCRIRPKLTTLHTPSLACLSSSIHSPGFWLASAFPSGAALHNVLSQPVRPIPVPPLPNRCPVHADLPSTNCFAARSHVSSSESSTTPNSVPLVGLGCHSSSYPHVVRFNVHGLLSLTHSLPRQDSNTRCLSVYLFHAHPPLASHRVLISTCIARHPPLSRHFTLSALLFS